MYVTCVTWTTDLEDGGCGTVSAVHHVLCAAVAVKNLNLGRLQYRDITDEPEATVERLTGLNPNTTYRVYLRAATRVGTGEPIFIDATTQLSGRKLCSSVVAGERIC